MKGIIVTLAFLSLAAALSAQGDPPFSVNDLFDHSEPETLGLCMIPGAETITVFSPGSADNKYNHGVVLFPFKGMLYAQWQSSAVDEDSPDTKVFYSRSSDGKCWSAPLLLADTYDGILTTGGGWWSDGDTLVAYLCRWRNGDSAIREGYTVYFTSVDGEEWSDARPVTDFQGDTLKGIIEQDVHSLSDGRIITAFHLQPGLQVTPFFTDDRMGVSGWRAGVMEHLLSDDRYITRELEPSWFYRSDGAVVMIFRDQTGSFRSLASVSYDRGVTWSTPVVTDIRDSRAKQSAGNLPDGTAFIVNNPSGTRNRFPLVLTVSSDGFVFDRAYLLRSGGDDMQSMRYQGRYKRPGFSYPKSVVWGSHLFVGYATNKEDVEITRIPIDCLR